VLADPEKLRRILANGIRNAIQSMGEGGHLRIVARAEDRGVEIRIEDSGPGIPESELPLLFTPFHTTKADGTGLGLAYSKKTVEGMNGEIDLTNRRETAGAVLTILLPNAG
jgi:signal transduction histidine kinase